MDLRERTTSTPNKKRTLNSSENERSSVESHDNQDNQPSAKVCFLFLLVFGYGKIGFWKMIIFQTNCKTFDSIRLLELKVVFLNLFSNIWFKFHFDDMKLRFPLNLKNLEFLFILLKFTKNKIMINSFETSLYYYWCK